MNKFIIFLLIIINTIQIYCNQSDNELIKRKVLILPFFNKNKIAEYDYLSDIISETLRAELIETHEYDFTNFSSTDDKLRNIVYKTEDFMDLKKAKEIASRLNVDVVVTGQYIILEKHIMILIHVIDVLSGELVALTKEEGNIGVELFNIINKASKDMAEKIVEKLPMLKKNEYDLKVKKNMLISSIKKAEIGLFAVNCTLFAIGLPIFIYDLAGYSQILSFNKQKYLSTYDNYSEYTQAYYTYVSLLITSICSLSLSFILAIIELPLLLIYLKENKKVNISFLINLIDNSNIYDCKMNFFIKIRI